MKKIVIQLGGHMTKEIFASSVAKVIPILGGIISGGLTYATFKPCAIRLRNVLQELPISDPEHYK